MEAAIERAILEQTAARSPEKTVCPADVARALDPAEAAWRALLPRVREAAARLQAEGRLRVTQKGVEVDARTARGPIRLGVRRAP